MSEAVVARKVHEVMEIIAKEIPADQTEAHRKIAWMRSTWPFRPPEFDQQNWADLAEMVNSLCKYPAPLDTDWKIKIVAILIEQPEDKVRAEFGAK